MAIARWSPRVETTRQEDFLLRRLGRVRKLFAFLRRHRHELFDEAFQDELAAVYRDTGAGKAAVPPALMAMGVLVQGYLGASDAEIVELTVVDLRVQMVLDRLGCEDPAFSQGALCDFRARLIEHNLDRRLLERTLDLAERTGEFDPKKLRNGLRLAIDSAPVEGAGRVEDTINLLAHAARKVVECAAELAGCEFATLCTKAGIPVLLESSPKRGLDVDWAAPGAKDEALRDLMGQLDSLDAWLRRSLPDAMKRPPLREHVETLEQIRSQDLEPDPGGGGARIKKGVARDRRVSIADRQMRHGRKSKSKRFNGYKRHLASDLDSGFIVGCAITPANQPEETAVESITEDMKNRRLSVAELHVDRGYINSGLVTEILARRGEVVCRPWYTRNGGRFPKSAFRFHMGRRTITCPEGQTVPFRLGQLAAFDTATCTACARHSACTTRSGGRTVAIADNELLQIRLRRAAATPAGRERLRERCQIEHHLAHAAARLGRRTRYLGVRTNLFDTRRASAIQNLERLHRIEARAAERKVA